MSTWVATTGARLGERYELEAKVGEGGMGEVWRAKHLALENQVAIKFLSGSLANNEETKKRFLMEAKLTAQLRSRHAVQVFDFGLTEDDQPYLVMELLHGEPLGARIDREKHLSLNDVAAFMGDAAKALHRAHALGIVHRDFKPDNVFLTKGEDREVEVKVVDFGIAKLIGSLEEARPSATDFAEITGKALSQLTRTGKLVGTPHYMSPEQVRMSNEVGPAADIWAFGVVAFEALTGVCPFDGGSVIELFSKIQLGNALSARALNPEVPAAFDDWFKVACAVDPSMRFPDAQVAATLLADSLGITLARRPISADASNPKISLTTSSQEISVVSSTDALSRSSSKNTLLSSATDHPAIPKKSRAALWGALASVLVLIGAVGAVKYSGTHAPSSHAGPDVISNPPPPAHVDSIPPVPPVPSATTMATLPEASASTAVIVAAPADSTNSSTISNKNAGKLHGSRPHGSHDAPTNDPAAEPSAQPAQPPPKPTATGPASPFSLPPLGL